MLIKDANGREIETEIGVSHGEAFFESGVYVDTGEELDSDELWALDELYPEALAEWLFDRAIEMAESAYEGER